MSLSKLKEDIKATPAPSKNDVTPITVKGWESYGTLYLRTMTALELDRFETVRARAITEDSVDHCFYAEFAALVLSDEDGNLAFKTKDDIRSLYNLRDITPLVDIYLQWSRLQESLDVTKKN